MGGSSAQYSTCFIKFDEFKTRIRILNYPLKSIYLFIVSVIVQEFAISKDDVLMASFMELSYMST